MRVMLVLESKADSERGREINSTDSMYYICKHQKLLRFFKHIFVFNRILDSVDRNPFHGVYFEQNFCRKNLQFL